MTQSSPQAVASDATSTLQQVLELLANIRNLAQPLATAAGLEQALTSLVQLASLVGVSAAWTARVQSILTDPAVFNVVLLIAQQLLGSDSQPGPAGPNPSSAPAQMQAVMLDPQTLSQWLPFITEIINLIQQIRGEQ